MSRSDAPEVEDPQAIVLPPISPLQREEEFAAYTEDCRIFGFIQLDSERLTDALNEQEAFRLDSVLLVALDDGRAVEARELIVHRDELLAVRAGGPRGNLARRSRMRPSPVILRTGPYTIHGYLHVPPGADPLQHIRHRRAMVPLTGAWIEYRANEEDHRARIGTIIVNRAMIEWVDRSRDEDVRMDLPVEQRLDPRAKDMTGYVRSAPPSLIEADPDAG
ncbi:MAG: hypothetical protein M3406_02630 [Chloroflexota bacterium]|nr:hypothetical protein [Chloroflexota bacterium]